MHCTVLGGDTTFNLACKSQRKATSKEVAVLPQKGEGGCIHPTQNLECLEGLKAQI